MKNQFAAALAAALVAMTCTAAIAADRSEYYKERFGYNGAYMRAYVVCNNEALLHYGMNYVNAQELVAFANAYPKTMEAWGFEGAQAFNRLVMKVGIPAACKYMTDKMNGSAR